jgi:hypothetical protein
MKRAMIKQVRNPRKFLRARTRLGVVWSLLAPLLLIGITNPQLAFAAPTISLPATLTAGTSFTSANGGGALSISGYDAGASVQVTVSVTSGYVKIATTTGLTAPTGYTSAAWTSDTSAEIAFYGSQTNVSNALNSLLYKATAVDAPATITVTSFVAGAAYNSTTGHFYEIVDNGSVINWELARCKALYSNSDVSVSAGTSLLNTNRCTSSSTLTRRTLGGLQGYLATITSQAEQDFIYGKLTSTGWIGGADTDSEGTFVWMDGPEKSQVFWTSGLTRRTTNTVTGSVSGFSYGSGRFNYFSDGEPNDAGGAEDFAEFGFGTNGAWNDCQNACNRTKYVIEYGETGDTLSGASGTINVNPRTAITTDTDTALSLSGSQYLSSAQESPFDIATGTTFTLEAWVKPTITNANQILIGKDNQYSLYISSNGSYGMNFYTTNAGGSGGDTSIFRAGSVLANQWQHVAVVRNGTSVTGYVNGQALATFTNPSATDAITAGSSPFVVGGYSTTNQTFTGQIDQVRVWSSARTAAEIQSGMSSFIPTPQTSLIASYGFNELAGTKIFNNATSSTWETDLTLNGGSSNWSQIAETSTVGAYSVVTFARSYLTAAGGWKLPSTVQRLQYLIVAGGGAGGTAQVAGEFASGGGGGGGVRTGIASTSSQELVAAIVGSGQVSLGCVQGRGQSSSISSNSISTISATGGGSGACIPNTSAPYTMIAANSGGSGGGGGSWATSSAAVGSGNLGSFSPVEGYAGAAARTDGSYSTGQAGGGGGGAGAVGGSPSLLSGVYWNAGSGGAGVLSTITGSNVYYGGGGGGGKRAGGVYGAVGSGGSGGGGDGGDASSQGTSGTPGLGGGGGGNSKTLGNDGGSGVIIIRWITASKPIFTGPNFDTLTAGLVETFTVSGTSTSPLTRSFRWQSSNDTGTTWSNASTGSGFLTSNYVTPTLETTTSGIRYQFRVVVTDSDTAGLFIVDTSTAVYLTINPRNTITSSTGSMSFTQKYGESRTVVFTFAFGTGTRTPSVTSTTNNQNGKITWSNLNSESATVRVGTGLSVGTYSETLTVTDSVTAFTTQALSITVSKADTITITTTLSISSVTYTESPAAITATQTIAGLVNSETGTATTTYMGNTCEYGGTCVIGDIAPGGGYVFYVSATTIDVASGISTGGIYLATAPKTWSGGSVDPTSKWGCAGSQISGTFSSAVGSGAENTRLITAGCATAGIAAQLAADASAEGFTDWFIPSIGELNLIYTNLKLNSLSNLNGTDYWSSTQDASSPSSYAQYQWFGGGSYGPTDKNNTLSVRAIRAFSPTALVSNTIPTDAGVYKVGSTFAISSPASLGNYLGVESVTATLTINKARQKTITIGQYDAYPNISSYPLNVYGGSGPGTVTRTLVSAGTAGCSLTSAFILTATSTGTCTVKAEKAGTRNYIVESTTAVIYWIAWSNNYTAQTIEGNHAISVSGSNGIVVRTETVTASAFSNTSGGAITSAAIGTTIRINSTGFSGLSPSDLSVTFRPYEDAVISAVTSTYVEVVIPAGASTGVIAIDSPRGVAYTQSFTIAP